jgi:RES domain-containing protein
MPIIHPNRLYRVQTDSHRDTILDGTGARLRGGRWNAKGTPMVYLATTPELCLLEYMVHLEGSPLYDVPPLIVCEISIPDNSILFLEQTQLPHHWDAIQAKPSLAQFMAEQFAQHSILCIGLPSAIMPRSPSRNIVLNPIHPDRARCRVEQISLLTIDPRLPTATAL